MGHRRSCLRLQIHATRNHLHRDSDTPSADDGHAPCRSKRPNRSVSATRLSSVARNSVSNRPLWLVDAACLSIALPPTIQRMERSRPRRSASFTSSYPAKRPHGLPEETTQTMTPVLPGTWVDEVFTGDFGEAQHVIEFSIDEQPGIRGDFGTGKFQPQTTVEIQPPIAQICFTRRVCHSPRTISPLSI